MAQLLPDFPDIKDHWAAGTIRLAAALGIVGGYKQPDGTYLFKPEQNMTRAEAVSMTVRALRVAAILAGAFALGAYVGAVYTKPKGKVG